MIIRFLFYAMLGYLLFRFIFDFLIPVFNTTRQVRQQFRNMQDRMQDSPGSPNHTDYHRHQETSKIKEGEYIDYEEVK
jgi:hypothetical protein